MVSGRGKCELFCNLFWVFLCIGEMFSYFRLSIKWSKGGYIILIVIVVQLLCHTWIFASPCAAAHQASLSFTISRSSLKLMSFESVMPSNHLVLHHPHLLPSVFPSIKVFSDQLALHIRWPKYWSFSFSISPSNEYSCLIPLGMTSLISLQSKGYLRVFSNTIVWKHQFFSSKSSLWLNSHIHTWLLEKQ